MKTDRVKEGQLIKTKDSSIKGNLIFNNGNEEYYVILRKKNINWFQKLLHKLLGFKVI